YTTLCRSRGKGVAARGGSGAAARSAPEGLAGGLAAGAVAAHAQSGGHDDFESFATDLDHDSFQLAVLGTGRGRRRGGGLGAGVGTEPVGELTFDPGGVHLEVLGLGAGELRVLKDGAEE